MDYELIASFFTLSLLEIVLGIDNVVFIAILVSTLPKDLSKKARTIGLALALIMRIGLLFGLVAIMKMTEPVLEVFGKDFSGKDILMLIGGMFLIYKATGGVHEEFTKEEASEYKKFKGSFLKAIAQITFVDLIFSLDSIMTAVGLTTNLWVIVSAMVLAMAVMVFASGYVSDIIAKYPTVKILALSFILLIGVFLVAEGMGVSVPKGYIYFAMAFSLLVETLNITSGKRKK